MFHRGSWVGVLGIAALIVACEDKAKPAFERCTEAEAKKDWQDAVEACEFAVKRDPASASGKAAAQKLVDMRPSIEAAKVEKAKADAIARVEQQKAQAKQLGAALANATIERASWSDGSCLSAGLPPKSYRFAATPADANLIASIGGCSRRHDLTPLEQCYPADFERRVKP